MHNDLLYVFGGLNDLGVTTATLFRAVLSRQQVDRACAGASAAAFGDNAATVGGDSDQQVPSAPGDAGSLAAGPNSTAAVLQLEWEELEADLPYNKSRATVMQQGHIRCYQLGSATLGRSINEDDAEKGTSAHGIVLHRLLDYCAWSRTTLHSTAQHSKAKGAVEAAPNFGCSTLLMLLCFCVPRLHYRAV